MRFHRLFKWPIKRREKQVCVILNKIHFTASLQCLFTSFIPAIWPSCCKKQIEISFLCICPLINSLLQALGQWGRSKKRVQDERDLVKKKWGGCWKFSATSPIFFNRSRSSRARFFDRPYWMRAWNTLLINDKLRHNFVKVYCGTTRLRVVAPQPPWQMNIMMQFIIDKKTDASKTDINLLNCGSGQLESPWLTDTRLF